jgi:hypothetical protein
LSAGIVKTGGTSVANEKAGASEPVSGSNTAGSAVGQATANSTASSADTLPAESAAAQSDLSASRITPVVLGAGSGWSAAQTIMVFVSLVVLVAIIGPGVVFARRRRRRAS